MVASHRDIPDGTGRAADRLDSLLEDVRQHGVRRVFDRDGNVFEIRPVDFARSADDDGPRDGESITDWVARTLPAGEPLDTTGLRNPERAGLYPAWMWEMWESAEPPSGQDGETNVSRESGAD